MRQRRREIRKSKGRKKTRRHKNKIIKETYQEEERMRERKRQNEEERWKKEKEGDRENRQILRITLICITFCFANQF